MSYVDGFVVPVPTARREAYLALAGKAAAIFKEHGAQRVVECWGDDVPAGKVTSFPISVQLAADETVVFAWIVWPSKVVRDAGMKSIMQDERMASQDMPFDAKRMIFGGFEVMLDV